MSGELKGNGSGSTSHPNTALCDTSTLVKARALTCRSASFCCISFASAALCGPPPSCKPPMLHYCAAVPRLQLDLIGQHALAVCMECHCAVSHRLECFESVETTSDREREAACLGVQRSKVAHESCWLPAAFDTTIAVLKSSRGFGGTRSFVQQLHLKGAQALQSRKEEGVGVRRYASRRLV